MLPGANSPSYTCMHLMTIVSNVDHGSSSYHSFSLNSIYFLISIYTWLHTSIQIHGKWIRKQVTSSSHSPENKLLLLLIRQKTSYFFFSFARKQVTSSSHSPENKLLLLLIHQKTSYFFFSFARKQVTSSSHSPENKLLKTYINSSTVAFTLLHAPNDNCIKCGPWFHFLS